MEGLKLTEPGLFKGATISLAQAAGFLQEMGLAVR
jgi:hypothetical protein